MLGKILCAIGLHSLTGTRKSRARNCKRPECHGFKWRKKK